jgi:hypothetical protein
MKSASGPVSTATLIILFMTLASSAMMHGQEGLEWREKGVPWDWTHHHLVFSRPSKAFGIVNDPRYVMQQRKRAADAAGATRPGLSQDASGAPLTVDPTANRLASHVGHQAEGARPTEMTLEERQAAQAGSRSLPSGLIRAIIAPPVETSAIESSDAALEGSEPSDSILPDKKKDRIKTDWSETEDSGGTTGLGEFPATYTTGSTSCTDFAVFNTGLAGSSSQASIIAYENLYTNCSPQPKTYWAFNTGGAAVNSVVLSLDGTQVAFVQTDNTTGDADLVVLKWASGSGSISSPTTLTSNSSYPTCTAPCMIVLPFHGTPTDTYSSPFIAYGTSSSTIYVGDDVGVLHKFANIFSSSTPAETTTAGWPVTVNANASLGSPIYDAASTLVFVGDYLFSSSSGCEPSATNSSSPCGYLYSVTTAGSSSQTVVKSAQLDFNIGILDSPVVDSSAAKVYVFVGDDGSTNCTSSTPCAAVYQFPVSFTASATGTEATVGPGYEFMMSGTFDNAYYSSSNSTGHLYVVGNTGPANNTLYQVSISNNVMSTSTTAGPVVSTNYSNGYYSAALQINEIYASSNDYIFLSVLSYGGPSACGTASLGNGCVIGYNVTSGTISGTTAVTGATAEAGGTSGIVVDNASANAQNIYFSTLLNQTCTTSGGTGGCAIQTSQSAP